MVTTAGSASGTTATASATPKMSISTKGWPRNSPRATMTRTTTNAARASALPTRSRFSCKGVLPVSTVFEHPRDLAELGLHARGDDQRAAAPVGHGRARVGHVLPVACGQSLVCRVGACAFRPAPTRPSSAASTVCRFTASISRTSAGTLSPVARRMRSPGTSSRAGTAPLAAVADDGRRGRGHLAQSLDGALGAVLLHEAEDDREEHDDGDGDGLDPVAEEGRERRRAEAG